MWREFQTNTVEGVFAIGRQLMADKEELPHGEFQQMVRDDLEFSPMTARMIMIVTRSERLQNVISDNVLPGSYNTLYLLTRLDDRTFGKLLRDGTIRSDMGRSDVSKELRLARVKADEERVLKLVPKPGIYRTLVIDPAWEYDWLSIAGRAKPGYAMQSLDQLRALDLKQWCDHESGTHLYCWVTNNFMYEAGKLIEGWGFQHRTILTWHKPPPFGLGSYFRNDTEHVIFATFGETTTRPAASSIATWFEAPRGAHSEKPDKFYEIVRAASYPPYGEGNQREKREGFAPLWVEEP
jgi:N6-adenosine-specific RNA methylase IME4